MIGKKAIGVIVMGLAACAPALAGPPAPERIVGSAVWAAHVDFEALTRSALANGVMDLATGKDSPLSDEEIRKAREGWKVIGKVKSLTVFSGSARQTDAVVVAELFQYDRKEIEKLLGVAGDARQYPCGKHTLLEFTPHRKQLGNERRREKDAGPSYVCFYDAGTILVGADRKPLAAALDVLDGKGKALPADGELAGLLSVARGAFLVAGVTGLKDLAAAADAGGAVMLKKIDSLRVEVGEQQARVSVRIEAMMANEQDAANVRKMCEGLLALASLQQPEDQDVAALLSAVKIAGEGKSITLSVAMPVEDILLKIEAKMKARTAGGAIQGRHE